MRRSPLIAALAALCALASPAHAHVVASPDAGPANGYFRTALRVGHGCAGSATTAVRVKMPDGIVSAKPQAKPGWEIEVRMRKLATPIDNGHGGVFTEAVDEIAWRGKLPDAWFDEFGLSLKLPDDAGRTLFFPTVQECESGVHRWIEIPAAGQRWRDLKSPAPFVRLVAPATE